MERLKKYGTLEENVNLKSHNTYKVDATTKYMFYPNNINDLIESIKILKEESIKFKILGKGSNLIFNFIEYDGVLIKLDKFDNVEYNGNIIKVGAGYPLTKLAYESANKNLSGLEFASGIPGTLGGAVFMNAGAYNSDMSAIVEEATLLTPDYEIKVFKKEELEFSYRSSFIKKNKDFIVIDVTLKLEEGNKEEILNIINDRATRRKESQPLEYPSAGSVFRNPEGDYAGRLIEEQGFKGYNINGAEVSTKHANFIINKTIFIYLFVLFSEFI